MKKLILSTIVLLALYGCSKTTTETIDKANVLMRSALASDVAIDIEKDSEKLFESNAETSYVCGRATVNQPGLFDHLVQRFIISTDNSFHTGISRFESVNSEKVDSEFIHLWSEQCQHYVLRELQFFNQKQSAVVARRFDLNAQSIPKDFTPDNPQTIFDAANRIRLLKNEFENTKQYTIRYDKFSKEMMEKLNLNRELAFEISPRVNYDADKGMFTYDIDCTKYQCRIASQDDSNGDHESINTAVANEYGLGSRNIPWTKIIFLKSPGVEQRYISPIKETLSVKIEDAAKMKNSLALIIIGRVVKPFGSKNGDTYPGELNDYKGVVWNEISFKFSGIWLINKDTGEILKKRKILN